MRLFFTRRISFCACRAPAPDRPRASAPGCRPASGSRVTASSSRLRETDELQKCNPSVHRLDRGDGRVTDDGQPRDGRVQLRVQGAAVAGDVRARLEEIAGLIRVARQLGQQVERPRAGLGIALAHLQRHLIAPFAVLGAEGRHARIQLAHAVGDDVLIALARVVDGEAVEIFVAAEGRAVAQLALKAHRLRLGIAPGKGRLDRVPAGGPVGVLFSSALRILLSSCCVRLSSIYSSASCTEKWFL